jgi:hypothetical protein
MTKRLIQVALLAAVLGLVLPATANASTIPLNFSQTSPSNFAKFDTGDDAYRLILSFDQVDGDFSLDVTADIFSNQVALPPGYTCVPVNGGTNCILFTINNIVGQTPGVTFTGSYTIEIQWNHDTNSLYPNAPVAGSGLGAIRILHYDANGVSDITDPGSYCAGGAACSFDPGIAGRDDGFSQFIVTRFDPVPEPGSLVLLGTGILGVAYGLRRQRRRKV